MTFRRLVPVFAALLLSSVTVSAQTAPPARPAPSTAPAAARASWFTSTRVSEGVWVIDDNGSDNMYLVEGRDKALLIDTGLGAARLAGFVKTLTSKPLMVVNTHGHPDHAGANYQFKTVYAHPADFAAIREMGTPEARARSIKTMAAGKAASDMVTADEAASAKDAELVPVKDGYVFDLGGRRLEVIETPGHTAGEIVLLDAASKQLFTGDNDNGLVWLFLPNCLPLEVYLQSLKKLERRSAEFHTIFPGHGVPLPAEFLGDQIRCVESILDGTCGGEPYQSFAGSAMTCKYGSATVAFNPKNLRTKGRN
jgi:hydroxyacylglutathione hydrolase